MRDQAKLANMHLFMIRTEERQRQVQPTAAEVDKLAEMIAGQPPQEVAAVQQGMTPPPPPPPPPPQPQDVSMDTGTIAEAEAEKPQGDDPMLGDGASTDKGKDAGTEGT